MKLHIVAKKQIDKTGMAAIFRPTERAAKQTEAHLVDWARNRSFGRNSLSVAHKEIADRFMIVAILKDADGNHLVK